MEKLGNCAGLAVKLKPPHNTLLYLDVAEALCFRWIDGAKKKYPKIRTDTIQSVRSQPKLFKNRPDKFITHTKENQMCGQWHDHGHLLDYWNPLKTHLHFDCNAKQDLPNQKILFSILRIHYRWTYAEQDALFASPQSHIESISGIIENAGRIWETCHTP